MTTYNTGNPIGSTEVKDLYDNAENLDIAINSPSADVWTDRLGQARKTWRGIQSEAQLEIAQVVGEVTAQSQQYLDASIVARDEARAAASASGPIAFYGTYAAAQAAVGGLPDGGIVEVSQDETRVGARTRYKVQAGALVFVVNLDQTKLDLAAATGASMVGVIAPGADAVATTVAAKLGQTVYATDYMSAAERADILLTTPLLDHTASIQKAINASFEGGKVLFPFGTYRITSTLTFTYIAQTLEGVSYGGMYGRPKILWDGVLGGIMIKAANGKHYPTVRNFQLDANRKANTCLYIEVNAGSQTNNPTLEHITFIGYVAKGLVFGDDNDAVLNNGQMSNVYAANLQWRGGGIDNAIGCFVNAQNIENLTGSAWYFDPWPDAGYFNHQYHIRMKAGGLVLNGLLTTRANSFAIDTDDNVAIYGWRAEDRYLFRQNAINNNAPSTLSNVVQRPDAAYLAGDYTMVLNGLVQPVSLLGATLQGSVLVGASSARSFVGLGLSFPLGGSVVHAGPGVHGGLLHDLASGALNTRGTSPSFVARNGAGAIVAELGKRTQFGYSPLPAGAIPDVSGGTVFGTNNVGSTTLSALTNLQTGQLVTLIGNDGGKTSVANSASIRLAGGVSMLLGQQDTITFIGGVSGEALEIARSNN